MPFQFPTLSTIIMENDGKGRYLKGNDPIGDTHTSFMEPG